MIESIDENSPQRYIYFLKRGLIRLRKSQNFQALTDFNEAKNLYPKSIRVYIAYVLLTLFNDNIEKANQQILAVYNMFIKTDFSNCVRYFTFTKKIRNFIDFK